jgi:hypothetical protein
MATAIVIITEKIKSSFKVSLLKYYSLSLAC